MMRTGLRSISLAVALVLVVTACSSGTSTTGSDSTPAAASVPANFQEVYDAVAGLSGQARRDRLVELAKAENGTVTVYTADSDELLEDYRQRFPADTGMGIEFYRASSPDVLARAAQEHSAGRVGGAAMLLVDADMWPAVAEGLCVPLPDSPEFEGIIPGGVHRDWVVTQTAPYVLGWNTSRVPAGEVPTSWEDAFSGRFDGELGIETTAWFTFANLIIYMRDHMGMSESEAIDVFKTGAAGARTVEGHPNLGNLVTLGELGLAPNYQNIYGRAVSQGAPVAYQPVVTPVPTSGPGVCMLEGTSSPASALLYLEWRATNGQTGAWETTKLTGSNPRYGGPGAAALLEVPDDQIVLAPQEVFDDRAKWMAVYDEILAQAAG